MRQYPCNKEFSKEELTLLVRKYRSVDITEVEKYKCLKNISIFVQDLTKKYLHKYGIYKMFPPVISEEVFRDCQTFILLKAISTFKYTCKSNFSTWYTYKLRSYLSSQREKHTKRLPLYSAYSMNSPLPFGIESDSLVLNESIPSIPYATYAEQEVRVFSKEANEILDKTMTKVGKRIPNYQNKRRLAKDRLHKYLSKDFVNFNTK